MNGSHSLDKKFSGSSPWYIQKTEVIPMTINVIDTIKKISHRAHNNYLEAIRHGGSLFKQHSITTPLRMTHFLAQALHETGGFTILRENMNYSAPRLFKIFGVNRHSAAITAVEAERLARQPEAIAERVYGLGNPCKARDLGNTEPGDGFRYRGNGVLQTTGRDNHSRVGTVCKVDFENNPDLVTAPEHALKPALQIWTDHNLNIFADKNDIRTITRCINGGFNGFDDRKSWFNKIWPLLKDADQPEESWKAGDEDNYVKWLQESLNDLGADPKLLVDGRYGPATRQAVKNFQAAVGIVVDGIAGPVTEAAIKLRLDTIRGVNQAALQ
jgi:putative chitinase